MLTICVIGRNEAKNLPRLISSLKPLEDLPFPVETIFVDSDSSDSTAEIARTYFDKTYCLRESRNLCASAGRYFGTTKALGNWVLYLDGDMELCKEFVSIIADTVLKGPEKQGVIGTYEYVYECGKTRKNVLRHRVDVALVDHFGGAVLLPLNALRVQNWNPGVFSNEEIDLYSRLRSLGISVRFVDAPMIKHYTRRLQKWRIVLENFIPIRNGLGKKFYGFGQLLAARAQEGSLINLMRFYPYPFIYWSALALALLLSLSGDSFSGVVVIVAGALYIVKRKGSNFLLLYVAFVVQALAGWRLYDQKYVPVVKTEYIRSRT